MVVLEFFLPLFIPFKVTGRAKMRKERPTRQVLKVPDQTRVVRKAKKKVKTWKVLSYVNCLYFQARGAITDTPCSHLCTTFMLKLLQYCRFEISASLELLPVTLHSICCLFPKVAGSRKVRNQLRLLSKLCCLKRIRIHCLSIRIKGIRQLTTSVEIVNLTRKPTST